MKKGNAILLLFLFFLIYYDSYSQTEITLVRESNYKNKRLYNMENAEFYIIDEIDTHFVTKIGEYKFQIEQEVLMNLSPSSDGDICLLFKTNDYFMLFKRSASLFYDNNKVFFYFYLLDNINYVHCSHYHSVFVSIGFVTVTKRDKRAEFYEKR